MTSYKVTRITPLVDYNYSVTFKALKKLSNNWKARQAEGWSPWWLNLRWDCGNGDLRHMARQYYSATSTTTRFRLS